MDSPAFDDRCACGVPEPALARHAKRSDDMLALLECGVWELHPHSRTLSWSSAVSVLHGYAETEDAPGLDSFLARLTAADRDRLSTVVLEGAAEAGRAMRFTYQWTRGTETRHFRARCIAEHDAD
jgi:hypothetical protein